MTQLCDLLHRTLQASEHEIHTLDEELAYVDAYLKIEYFLQPSCIDWRVRVHPRCAAARVPSLILLPLIENAVKHGLRGNMRAIYIEVRAEHNEDELRIVMSNSCKTLDIAAHIEVPGPGLRHVKERLGVMYGSQATLETGRIAPGRWETRIRLPLGGTFGVPPPEIRL